MRGALRVFVVVLVLAALGGAVSWFISWRREATAARMRAQLVADVERGGLSDLARAQVMARRLIVTNPDDHEAGAALAFADAALQLDYGLDTSGEARSMVGRHQGAIGSNDTVTGMLVGARALLLIAAGDREGGARVAVTGTAAAPGDPHPLYALGRARALAGELGGAARALEAAIVRTPGFLAARLAWAEVRLDQGDAKAARPALQELVAKAPDNVRARLLLDEAELALGTAPAQPPAACTAPEKPVAGQGSGEETNPTARSAAVQAMAATVERSRWPPAAIGTACALGAATRARQAGRRAEASTHAERAAGMVPNQGRLLARTAETLAQLGLVDWAAALLERGRKLAAAETPTMAWAALAVVVGRGRVPTFPGGPRPADPESLLLAARASLAVGGAGALGSLLDSLPPAVVAADRDLVLLSRLGKARHAGGPALAEEPMHAYVDGLRAKLDGDLSKAAEWFGRALSGHGDACRAAGEYVATMGLLKRPVPPDALTPLRAENSGCVNVH